MPDRAPRAPFSVTAPPARRWKALALLGGATFLLLLLPFRWAAHMPSEGRTIVMNVAAWLVATCWFGWYLLREVAATERLDVDGFALVHTRQLLGWRSIQTYDLALISNPRTQPAAFWRDGSYVQTMGRVAFDYPCGEDQTSTVELAPGLSDAAAGEFIRRMQTMQQVPRRNSP